MTKKCILPIILLSSLMLLPPRPNTGPSKVTGNQPHPLMACSTGHQDRLGHNCRVWKKVKVHYTGWLTSGKKFDSSVGKAPFDFTLGAGQVIKAGMKAWPGMKSGGKRQLRIPPELGLRCTRAIPERSRPQRNTGLRC